MIKTILASNSFPIKTGGVQIQSSTPNASTVNKGLTQLSEKLPVFQQSIPNLHAGIYSEGSTSILANPSLSIIADSLSKPGMLLPTLRGEMVNNIVPNFHFDFDPNHNLPQSSDQMSVSTKKFEPYEHLTGISQERPEIVMLTNFLPLFVYESSTDNEGKWRYSYSPYHNVLTPAGEFFDAQMHVRTLRMHNVKELLSTLKERYGVIKRHIADRNSAFTNVMSELNHLSYYLWTVMSTLERVKQQLDVRDDLHVVDPHETLRKHVINFSSTRAEGTLRHLTTSINTFFRPQYDMSDVLSLFGYSKDNTQHTYTSTKIWLQMLLELKYVLRSHSLNMLDIDPVQQRKDTSSINITQSNVKRFEYTSYLPTLPTLDELKDIQPNVVNITLNQISTSYQKIYESVNFKNEEQRLACLINLISREYRYSRGLANNDVLRALGSYYGYSSQPQNNLKLFDSIIGQFGNNISDVSTLQSNALTFIAQQQPSQNVAVLPLESRYIEGDTGVLTPGSNYYVDPVLITNGKTFNVTRLTQLKDILTQAYKQFNIVIDGMNLLSSEYVDHYNESAGTFEVALNNPRALFEELRKHLMSADNILPDLLGDPLIPVFSEASTNIRLRSLLLMYLIVKLSRAYTTNISFFTAQMIQDNTPTSDALVEQIIVELLKKPQATQTAISAAKTNKISRQSKSQQNNVDTYTFINIDSIRATLKHGGRLLSVVENIMGKILTSFKADNMALNGSVTRYGGHSDTVVMMTVLDVITGIVKNYSNRRLSGQHIDNSITQLVVSERSIVHTNSINDINERLAKEVTLIQHVIFAILNTLDKLGNSLGNVINYLTSPNVIVDLEKISAMFDDPNLIQMLFSEQQIRLFASSVADINLAFTSHTRAGTNYGDINGSGEFDADDEIQALDDSEISPRMRDAIDDVLSLPEFTQASSATRKILTVGIPLGFARHLRQKVDIKKLKNSSFVIKQNDIVNIVVNKVDITNPDIIYKPVRFLFELSRFPVRNENYIKEKQGNHLVDYVSRFATRDSSQSFSEGGAQMQYLNPNEGEIQALGSSDYSFLKQDQKQQLYTNHVLSYLMEIYLKIMTGMSTADYHFDIVEPPPSVEGDFVKLVTNHHINYVAGVKHLSSISDSSMQHSGLFFGTTNARNKSNSSNVFGNSRRALANSSGIIGKSPTNALSQFSDENSNTTSLNQSTLQSNEVALSNLSRHNMTHMLHTMGVINEFSRMVTPLSDSLAVAKRLIRPKQFDRVFNILIDPFQFEIDVMKTNSTPHGKQALELLIKQGDVIPVEKQTTFHLSQLNNTKTYVSRHKDTSEGDLMFEKYIVSIETVGEEEV